MRRTVCDDQRQAERDSRSCWQLINGCLSVREPSGTLVVPRADEIYRLAIEGDNVLGLPPIRDAAETRHLSFSKYPLRPEITVEAYHPKTFPSSILQLSVRAVCGTIAVPLNDVSEGALDHFVAENTWYPLAAGSLEEIRAVLEKATIKGQGPISLKQYLMLRILLPTHPIINDNSAGAANAKNHKASPSQSPSPLFIGTLFPYQADGLRWLTALSSEGIGGILADEMGLGKTIQIIAQIADESAEDRGPSLVVAPGTLLENWRRELQRFAPSLSVTIHHGRNRTGFPRALLHNDIVVTSYDTLVRDISLFKAITWNFAVLDEAQAIKNPDTLRASTMRQLRKRVGLAVTGTPVENSLRDLWSLAQFIAPGFLGSRTAFETRFQDDETGAAHLEPFISPLLLRRRLSEVAKDLPERIDIPQALELQPTEAEAYDTLRLSTIREYGSHANFVALTRLRMFCTHPRLLDMTGDVYNEDPTKYHRLLELLDEIFSNGHKTLVFTSFTGMVDIFSQDIPKRFAVPTFFIDGRTAIRERQEVVDHFSKSLDSAVLILNPRAAGTGLNITAANHVIHYNLEWNPAVEDQASARSYRLGQTSPVTIHRLFYANTVEEIIDNRVSRKRRLAEAAVIGKHAAMDDLRDVVAALRKSPLGTSRP